MIQWPIARQTGLGFVGQTAGRHQRVHGVGAGVHFGLSVQV